MFDNIGRKLKTFANIVGHVGIITCLIIGIFFLYFNTTIGFIILILGTFVVWFFTAVLYGFGELIENQSIIAKNTTILAKFKFQENNTESTQSKSTE